MLNSHGYNADADMRLAIVAFCICEIQRNSLNIRTYSSSRSCKVIDLGVNRKRICNFLLVINSTFARISNFEILTFKARKLLVFLTLPCLTPHSGEPIRIF